jgi:predicted nucleic acid-binding protein
MTAMPEVDKGQLRHSLIPDTNIVFAFFNKNDRLHAEANWLFDEFDRNWIVLSAVAVETWGLFTSCGLSQAEKLNFLAWLITPGKVIYWDDKIAAINECNQICLDQKVDLVDAIVVESAHTLSLLLGGRRNEIPIITADSDFWRLRHVKAKNLLVYDIRSEVEEIQRAL